VLVSLPDRSNEEDDVKRQLRATLVCIAIAGLTVTLWMTAATGKPTIAACKAGKPCICTGTGACVRNCAGPGCKFECHATGSCTFNCPKGKCESVSDGVGATSLACPGNGCTMTCSGVGSCTLSGCKKDCKASCTGVGVCTNTCSDPSCR
jgi:hypothetical protein